jgi:GNAT superfamily N-acetyltransferase
MRIRDFHTRDSEQVNRIALAAFDELRAHYDDWPALASGLGRMAALADRTELIVAEHSDRIVGAVAYVGPDRDKADFFDLDWPIIRLLVVDPDSRGIGAGRALTEECIARAERDGASVIALHTSPIMTVALPMYLRMGFELVRAAPPIHGVPYSVYLKAIHKSDE